MIVAERIHLLAQREFRAPFASLFHSPLSPEGSAMPSLRIPRRPREFAARLPPPPGPPPPRDDSAPLARSFLRAYLAGLPRGERYSDIAELLLGELVTNAVRHSDAPPDRLVEVRFAVVPGDRLRLEVHDAGTGRPVLRPSVGHEEESGRGLLLVDELAERWGCCPRAGGIGKFVWALVSPAPGFTELVFGRSPRLVTV